MHNEETALSLRQRFHLDRLDDALLADAVREVSQHSRISVLARLFGIRLDGIQPDRPQLQPGHLHRPLIACQQAIEFLRFL